jgi:hypothetical protein
MNAQESVGEDPALQEVPEFGLAAVAGLGEKRFELLRDDLVENGLVCPAGSVFVRGDASVTSGGVQGPKY